MAKRLTYDFVKSEFEKEDYKLLSFFYKNSAQKLEYVCPKGHIHSISYDNFRSGDRCPFCSGKDKKTIDFIRHEFEKEGYTLLGDEYLNNKQKLEYVCPKGHRHTISWRDWKRGRRCYYCLGNIKPNLFFIKSEFEKEGYILLTTKYVNARQYLHFICPNGHKHKVTWDNWKSKGHRCGKCKISVFEMAVKVFVTSIGVDFVGNERGILINIKTKRFLELDIWIPTISKAIECNGEYWHNKKRNIERDKIKLQLCKQKKIELLTIMDVDWYADIDKCKDKIRIFIGDNND